MKLRLSTGTKFWQVETSGATHVVTFGKEGSNGQTREKTHASAAACKKAVEKLIKTKRGKGYDDTDDASDGGSDSEEEEVKSSAAEELEESESEKDSGGEDDDAISVYMTMGSSSGGKFWSLEFEGKGFTVRYGKIGKSGASQKKKFKDEATAKKEALKLIATKTKKGYEEAERDQSDSVAAPPKKKRRTGKSSTEEDDDDDSEEVTSRKRKTPKLDKAGKRKKATPKKTAKKKKTKAKAVASVTSNLLEDLKICISGSFKQSQALTKKLVTDNGGTLKSTVTKDLDYLLVGNEAQLGSGKCSKAQANDVPIVREDWIHESIEAGDLLDFNEFLAE